MKILFEHEHLYYLPQFESVIYELKKRGEKISKEEQIDRIGNVKITTKTAKLCEDLPECFTTYIDMVKKLEFFEDPDYDKLKSLFIDYAKNNNIKLEYSWIRDDSIPNN